MVSEMKVVNVLIISVLVIAFLAVPVLAQTSEVNSNGVPAQLAATVEGSAPQAYSNYFYFFTPGTAGNSECFYTSSCSYERHYSGHMEIGIKTGQSVYVNLPITQVASYSGIHPKVRYATVQMYNSGGSTGGYVTGVDVWNGGTFVKDVSTNWYTTTSTPTDFTLDLGGYYDMVRGMNMCLSVANTQITDQTISINGYGAKAEW
jgi:hypothetical protein